MSSQNCWIFSDWLFGFLFGIRIKELKQLYIYLKWQKDCGSDISNTFSHQSNEFMISMEYDVYYFRYNLHCMRIRFFFNIFVYH